MPLASCKEETRNQGKDIYLILVRVERPRKTTINSTEALFMVPEFLEF